MKTTISLVSSLTVCLVGSSLQLIPAIAQVTADGTTSTTVNADGDNFTIEQGDRLYRSGKFAQAQQVWQQAEVAFARQGNRLNQAMALSNLSLTYQKLNQWQQAEVAMGKSLELLKKLDNNPEKNRILAQTLDIKGQLLQQIGQSQAALVSWQTAGKIYQQQSDRQSLINNQINQAQAYQDLGFYPRACQTLLSAFQVDSSQCELSASQLQQLQSQLQTNQALYPPQVQIRGLASLGNILRTIGNLEQSQQVLQLSLTKAQKWHLSAAQAKVWLNLGNTQQALATRFRELDEQLAESYSDRALTSYQTASSIAPTTTVKLQAQLNQLKLLIKQEQWQAANNLSSSMVDLVEDLPLNRLSTFIQIDLAKNLICLSSQNTHCGQNQLSNPALTAPVLDRASYLKITNLLTTAVKRSQQLEDLRTQSYAWGNLGQLAEYLHQWQLAAKYTTNALKLAQQTEASDLIYQWQWQQGRLLLAEGKINTAVAAYRQSVETLQSLRQDLVSINPEVQFTFRETVEPIYREYINLLLSSPNQANLQQAIQAIDALQLAELENFFQLICLDTQPVSLNFVTDQIDPTTAIIYPILLADRWEIILKLPHQPLRHYSTPLENPAKTNRMVTRLSQSLTQRNSQETLPLAQELYSWLLRPLESALAQGQVNNLVFVLDSSLRNIPMAILHDGQQYLIEKYSIALTPSLNLLPPQPLKLQESTALTAGLTEARSGFPPLQFVAEELDRIQSQISTVKLVDREFTNDSLQNHLQNNSLPIIHLATHGQFSSQAAETFILTWDKRMNIEQLNKVLNSNQLRGSIDLLVLSACETLTGDKRAALGLAGIAVRAGTRSTLATLWSVNDEATALLMGQFYQALSQPNVTKAEALRLAQKALLKNPRFERPHFWASYVLVGNWL